MAKTVGMRGVLSLNTASFDRSLDRAGYKMQGFTDSSTKGISGMNAAILAGVAAWGTYASAGIRALSELQSEVAQVSYLYSGITDQQTRMLEMQTRLISGAAGVSAPSVAQGAFRLASGGTALQDIPRELSPIAALAAATGSDVGGTALSARQIAGLGNIGTRTGLDFLAGTAQVSTTSIAGVQALAPRVLPPGNILGLGAGESLGLLAAATQVSGTPEEGATGLVALLAESVKTDSKFARRFEETFGESFVSATKDKGYKALLDAWRRAFDTWGDTEFFSTLGRRAGVVGSALVAESATAGRVEQVAFGSAGLSGWIQTQWQTGVGELTHSLNLVRESNDELKYRIGEGARDGVIGALKQLNDTMNNNALGQTMENLGESFGRFALSFSGYLDAAAGANAPLAQMLTQDLIPGGNAFSAFDAGLLGFGFASSMNLARLGTPGGRLNRLSQRGPRLPQMAGGGLLGLSMMGGGPTLASLGMRGLGIAGAALTANELVTQTTGFNPFGETWGAVSNALAINPGMTGFAGQRTTTRADEWLRAMFEEASYQINVADVLTPEQMAIMNRDSGTFIPKELFYSHPDPRRPGMTLGQTYDASPITGLQALMTGALLDPGTEGFAEYIQNFARGMPEALAQAFNATGLSADQLERSLYGSQFSGDMQQVIDHLRNIEDEVKTQNEELMAQTYQPLGVTPGLDTIGAGGRLAHSASMFLQGRQSSPAVIAQAMNIQSAFAASFTEANSELGALISNREQGLLNAMQASIDVLKEIAENTEKEVEIDRRFIFSPIETQDPEMLAQGV